MHNEIPAESANEPIDESAAAVEAASAEPPTQRRRPGPNTPGGKARVSRNAIKHGVFSKELAVRGEILQGIVGDLAPVGPVDLALAERVAELHQRLRRVAEYEAATIAERQKLDKPSARLLPHPDEVDKIIKYEAHLNRQLYSALHELEARQERRRGQVMPLVRVDHHQTDARD